MVDTYPTLINHRWTLNLPLHRATLPSWPWWEKERLAAMFTAIRPGDTIIDVGSEQGDLSALYAKWAGPSGRVVLIEPSAAFWPTIRATFEANDLSPLWCLHALAGAALEGEVATTGQWPSAADGPIDPDAGFMHLNEHPADLPTVTLDTVAHTLVPLHIDVITMDVEGSEYEVLLGAAGAVYTHRPIIFVSVHAEMSMREHRHSSDDLLVMMDKWGYDATFLGFDHEAHYMFKPRP